mgnify:CR=1 FL=1
MLIMLSIMIVGCSSDSDRLNEEANSYDFQNSTMSEIEYEIYSDVILFYDENRDLEIEFTVEYGISEDSEELQYFAISDNFFDYTNLTRGELENEIVNETMGEHSDCMRACRKAYTGDDGKLIKGTGLGACRANCWIDTSIRVIVAVAEALSPL